MTKNLGWIAAGGIGVGLVAAVLAAALGADDWHFHDLRRLATMMNSCSDADDNAVRDSDASLRRWTWDGGDTVTIATPGTVHYRGGEGDEVIARGASGDIAHIKVHDGKIESCNHGVLGPGRVDITLPGRVFHSVALAGSGDLIMENVSQPELILTLAGSVSVQAKGASDHVAITIAGSGNAKLGDLAMKRLDITIAGSGKMDAAPEDEANIEISGSGDVNLLSHPARFHVNINGSGRVTQSPAGPSGTPIRSFQAEPARPNGI